MFSWVGGSGLWNIDLEPAGFDLFAVSTAFSVLLGEWEVAGLDVGGFAKEARCWVLRIRLRPFFLVRPECLCRDWFVLVWGLGSLVV